MLKYLFCCWYLLWRGALILKTAIAESETTRHINKGICLWSHGRSGSGTLAETFKKSINVKYCKHVKEGFRFQYPRRHFLRNCLLTKRPQFPPIRLTHIKPRHVTHSNKEIADTLSAKISLVKDFIKNLNDTGFETIIVHRRENTLAMLVSDFELKYKRKIVMYKAFERDFREIISMLQYNYVILEIGFMEAMRLNMSVIETDFATIAGSNSCIEFKRIFTILYSLGYDIPNRQKCVQAISHISLNKPRELQLRVGNKTASRIYKALIGTPYEWMLDLTANRWPKYISNPCSNIVSCLFNNLKSSVSA